MLKLAVCWSFLLTGLIGAMIARPDFRNRVLAMADGSTPAPHALSVSVTANVAPPAIHTSAVTPVAEVAPALSPGPVPMPPLPVVITPTISPSQDHAATKRRHNGHFYFDVAVNGTHLEMMFDTGASFVTLRAEDAGRMGIDMTTLRYTVQITTANGVAAAAPVMLAVITVGSITRHDVPAIVSAPGRLEVSLLGQSFLRRAGGYRQEGDELILTSSK